MRKLSVALKKAFKTDSHHKPEKKRSEDKTGNFDKKDKKHKNKDKEKNEDKDKDKEREDRPSPATPPSNEIFVVNVTSLEFEPGKNSSKEIQLTNQTDKNIAVKITGSDERITVEPELRLLVDKVPLNIRIKRKAKEANDDIVDESVTCLGVITTETSSEAAFNLNPKDIFKVVISLKSSTEAKSPLDGRDFKEARSVDGKDVTTPKEERAPAVPTPATVTVPTLSPVTKFSEVAQLINIDKMTLAFIPGGPSMRIIRLSKNVENAKWVAIKMTASDASRITIEPRYKILLDKNPFPIKITRKPKSGGVDDPSNDTITIQAIVTQCTTSEKAFEVEPKYAFKKVVGCSFFTDLQAEKEKKGAKVNKRLCTIDKDRLVFAASDKVKAFTIVNPADSLMNYQLELSSDNYKVSEDAGVIENSKELEVFVTIEKREKKEEKLNILCVEAKDLKALDVAHEVRATPVESRYVKTITLVSE